MAESQSISVLIVDDHPIIMRVGIASILTNNGFAVLAQTGTTCDAIRLYRDLHPDLTLMDLRLPDMSGIEAIQRIRMHDVAAKIVVLTTYEGEKTYTRRSEREQAGTSSRACPTSFY